MPSLLDLPPELLEHIISILAEERPLSERFLREEPSEALLRSDYHPLKDLSQACCVTRELCFPSLFSAVKVDLNSTERFLGFAQKYCGTGHIDSLVLYFDPDSQDIYSNKDNEIWLPMVRIVDAIKPSVMTVMLAPSLFENILPYKLDLDDEWAFSIRYQVLQLRMPRDLAPVSQTSQEVRGSHNVFGMREWTQCTFNQGTSIDGYSSYEYWNKLAPSIFIPKLFIDSDRTIDAAFGNLISLDYIAVFPIQQRVYHFSQFILGVTKKLKRLRVQFAPTPSNDVLDDPARLGKSQPGDLWQELEDFYSDLSSLIPRSNSIEEFISLDYVNPSTCELLDRLFGHWIPEWSSDPNSGRWTREAENSKPHDQ